MAKFITNTSEETLLTTPDLPNVDDGLQPVPQGFSYIFLPLCSLVFVIVFVIAALLFIQRKRRLDRLRHRLMPFYNFAPGEEEDWEAELLESEGELTVKRDYHSVSPSKLQQNQQ